MNTAINFDNNIAKTIENFENIFKGKIKHQSITALNILVYT